MASLIWWIKTILIGLASLFLLLLAVIYLRKAYGLSNPLEFIMVFFSQSLMLMIGAVGVIYTFFQVRQYIKKEKSAKNDQHA